jgi:hypothetical protein
MTYELPPIAKAAERLMREIEIAATRFPRAHRYTLGSDLRSEAMRVARVAHKAWRDREHQDQRLQELIDAVDDLKLRMQLAHQVRAFSSFAQFEALARIAADLGRQCGGWQKRRKAKGQNAPASSPAQRPSILSSRDTSTEVRT